MLEYLNTNPEMIKYLYENKLIDYIAMDIKNDLPYYTNTIGKDMKLDNIKLSIDYIMSCGIEYEFRTTVVKDYHEIADFHKIGEMIKNAKRYFIQSYKYQDSVRIKTLSAMTKEELQMCLDIVKEYVQNSSLREID